MKTKLLFIILRGIRLFISYLRSNLFSVLALSGLFLILHTVFGLGAGMAGFADSAVSLDKLRVYVAGDTAAAVEDSLKTLPESASTVYYTPKAAKEYLKDAASTLSGLEDLPDELFPGFIELTLLPEYQDLPHLEALTARIAAINGVERVSYGQEWANQLTRGKNAILGLLLIVSVLFGVVGTVLIYQTVSVTLYRYKREVRVYNIVGGTGFFITTPFVVVAACMSVLCSLFSFVFYLIFRVTLLRPIEAVLGLKISIGFGYCLIFALSALAVSMLAGLVSAQNFLSLAWKGED